MCRLSANHIRVRQQFKVRNWDIFTCMWRILVSYNDHRVHKSHLNLSQNPRFQPKYSDFDDIVVKRAPIRILHLVIREIAKEFYMKKYTRKIRKEFYMRKYVVKTLLRKSWKYSRVAAALVVAALFCLLF